MHKNAHWNIIYKCGTQCPKREKVKSTNIHMMTADKEQEEREFCENT